MVRRGKIIYTQNHFSGCYKYGAWFLSSLNAVLKLVREEHARYTLRGCEGVEVVRGEARYTLRGCEEVGG